MLSPYKAYPRWIRSIKKRLLYIKDEFFFHDKGHIKFILNKNHFIDRQIYIHGNFEGFEINQFMNQFLDSPPEVFIDIGSNFGIYSLEIANQFQDVEVHALEPDPESFSQLCANRLINNFCNRIEAHPIAASDQDSEAYLERHTFDPGNNRLVKEPHVNRNSTIPISRRRLDNLFDFKNKRILAKIDVEHHELEVIAGMPNLLADNAWLMMIESFPRNIDRLKKLLSDKGIRYIADWGDRNHLFSS